MRSCPDTDIDTDIDPSQAREIDAGGLLRQTIAIKSLSQAEKPNVLMNHYEPGTDFACTKVMMNGCNHCFQRGWLEKFPWFVFTNACDCGLSATHFLFIWWTKIGSACSEHKKLLYQADAVVACKNFLFTCRNTKNTFKHKSKVNRGTPYRETGK